MKWISDDRTLEPPNEGTPVFFDHEETFATPGSFNGSLPWKDPVLSGESPYLMCGMEFACQTVNTKHGNCPNHYYSSI
ncbi:MAG TPA: hypothetical protein VJ063_18540 [Verrucomicrobiae bacterium]|nr:hypothetical protein [Verrucomicrobiae bacterium]